MVDFGGSYPAGCNSVPGDEPNWADLREMFFKMWPEFAPGNDCGVDIIVCGYDDDDNGEISYRVRREILPHTKGGAPIEDEAALALVEEVVMTWETGDAKGEWNGEGWLFSTGIGTRRIVLSKAGLSAPHPDEVDPDEMTYEQATFNYEQAICRKLANELRHSMLPFELSMAELQKKIYEIAEESA